MRRTLAAAVAVAALLSGCGGSHHHAVARPGSRPTSTQAGYRTPYGVQAHSPTFGLPPKGLPQATAPSSAPTEEMFDSVTVSAVPRGSKAVAGYTHGSFPTFAGLVAAFPHAIHVPVAIQADEPILGVRMGCLDIEPGDAVPSQAGAWDHAELAAGVIPCDYANLSTMPAVRASIAAAGIPRSRVMLWVADWTFHPGLLAGYDADQWTDHGPQGQNYDESTASFAFLGIKPAPLLPVCFTHRVTRAQCATAKKTIARDQRAAASSQRAYRARGCITLNQRVSYFSTQLRKHPKTKTASRRRALTASRTAYRQRSCAVFHQRDTFFTNTARRIQATD